MHERWTVTRDKIGLLSDLQDNWEQVQQDVLCLLHPNYEALFHVFSFYCKVGLSETKDDGGFLAMTCDEWMRFARTANVSTKEFSRGLIEAEH